MATFNELEERAVAEIATALKKKSPQMSDGRAAKRAREDLSFAIEQAKKIVAVKLEVERRAGGKFSPEQILFFFDTRGVSKETSTALAVEMIEELRG
ncbi:MAG: hypothetical protein KBD50_01695 [Candidatus Pacebacteria bacterium]|nr:hypothetical protein [Candidatus Paceibacterota bacterium]